MTLHYHGIPLTPNEMLFDMAGECLCVSFATVSKKQLEIALSIAQSLMLDNGAFSIKQQGGDLDTAALYEWLDPILGHPHWAVVPDVIDGSVEEQRTLVKTWPFPREMGAPVFHIGLPDDYLLELVDNWPRVCLGSSGEFWQVGSHKWRSRMRNLREMLAKRRNRAPFLHGLRMMAQAGAGWGLASVDSVNVAVNYKRQQEMPHYMARRLNSANSSTVFPAQEFDVFQ